jgi:hypothetical protein
MPKRFTDSNKWQDEWFMDLPAKYKLFYLYLLDNCDHAGIWKVNLRLACFHIGEDIDMAGIRTFFGEKVSEFKEGYLFIKKFIQFQYGGLKNDSVGKSVYKLLETNNLLGAMEGLPSTCQGTKVKDKVKDKVKVKEEGGMGGDWESNKKSFLLDDGWKYKICTAKNLSKAYLEGMMQTFITDIELKEDYKSNKELKSHFTNWLNLQKKKNEKRSTKNPGLYELLEDLRQQHTENPFIQTGGTGT